MTRKAPLLLVLLLTCFQVHSGEALKVWTRADGLYAAKGNDAVMLAAPAWTTPSGEKGCGVELKAFASEASPWDIQLRYLYSGGLKAGGSYEISFLCKGSKPGLLQVDVAQAEKPWTVVSGAPKDFMVGTEWREFKLRFTCRKDFAERMVAPRVMLSRYGSPARLDFGPVTLMELPKSLPFDLGSSPWTLFPGVDAAAAPLNAIPLSMRGAKGEVKPLELDLKDDAIDIGALTGSYLSKDGAVLYKSFDCAEAGRMTAGFSADWWMEANLNGSKILSTIPEGNVSHLFIPDDHIVELPVRAGRNLLAVKVLAGSNGWRFVCGKPTRTLDDDSLLTIKEGRDWKALDMARLNVVPGSALDFGELGGARRPAGELGRLMVGESGGFVFEKAPGSRVRFLSFNTCPWKLSLASTSKESIAKYAEDVARQGYNMLRVQGADIFLRGAYRHPFKAVAYGAPGWLPLKPEDMQINKDALDRFDYLFACLKRNGVYLNLDLMNGGYTNITNSTRVPPGQGFSIQLLFNEEYRAHWLAGVSFLLGHANPYTGTSLKDDPALAIVEPRNEQDLLIYEASSMKALSPSFKEYLRAKYGSAEALRKAWGDPAASFATAPDISEDVLRSGDAKAEDQCLFLVKTMSAMNAWYFKSLRELGYKGLFTQWDMIMRTLELPVRAEIPVIAQHSYFSHPGPVPPSGLVPKSKAPTIWPGKDMSIGQGSSLNSSYFRAAAVIRFLDRPFMMTEYSHSAPNRYRHERGLFFGSLAALQGWDSLAAHGDYPAYIKGVNDAPFCGFESPVDPISRASEAVVALAWFRGDVKEAPHCVRLNLSNSTLFPKHILSSIGDDYAKLSMLTKIGIVYNGVKPLSPVGRAPEPSLEIAPDEFSSLACNQWYASASNRAGSRFPALLGKLRAAAVLPPGNKTDYAKRVYQSETGEITIDGRAETMRVETPSLEGAVLKKLDAPLKLGRLTISSCSKPASVVMASLEKGEALDESGRLLLVFATNALNSGETFKDSSMQLMLEVGRSPVLVETAKLALSLKTGRLGAVEAYALHMDGSRMARIPARLEGGELSLSLDTSNLPNGAVFFEIVIR